MNMEMVKEELQSISEEDLLVYGRYAKVAYHLKISNRTQQTYKEATMTLIIATYIGIGYSPSSFEVNLPLNALLVISLICVASLLVLGGIWYLDLIVEEKKIAKAVHNGLALEKKYSFLPRAFHNVVKEICILLVMGLNFATDHLCISYNLFISD
jgi:high-affinity Fe2+/Pb2+ permease